MPLRTIAAILRPDQQGPGHVIGSGSLVRERSVLVHPPLSHAFVAGSVGHVGLRVCVTSWARGTAEAQLVDVEDMAVANTEWATRAGAVTAARYPLVSLTLDTAVAMEPGPGPDTVDGIIAHLADPFDGTRADPRNPNPLCQIFGVCCF